MSASRASRQASIARYSAASSLQRAASSASASARERRAQRGAALELADGADADRARALRVGLGRRRRHHVEIGMEACGIGAEQIGREGERGGEAPAAGGPDERVGVRDAAAVEGAPQLLDRARLLGDRVELHARNSCTIARTWRSPWAGGAEASRRATGWGAAGMI